MKRLPTLLTVTLLPVTTAVMVLATSTVATAAGQPVTLSASVRLSDLDLSSETDRRAARDRIRQLAEQLCDELGESTTSVVYDFADCVSAASSQALRRLASIARQKSPRQVAKTESH